jgi:hypothetical protein
MSAKNFITPQYDALKAFVFKELDDAILSHLDV